MLDPNAPLFDVPEQLRPEILEVFLEEAGELVDQIVIDFSANNIAAVKLSAHKLKGSSASVGATEVTSLSRAIEHADIPNETQVDQLQKAFIVIRDHLS